MNKPSLTLVASFLAGTALAVAALWSAPVKADPLSDFLSGIFRAPHPPLAIERAQRRRVVAHVRTASGDARMMVASYYGAGEKLNARTANGEVFRPAGFTAAHRSLPFGARLSVCHRGCVVVRVNDRGPAAWTGRSLDLSRAAARAIGMTAAGVASVRVTRLGD